MNLNIDKDVSLIIKNIIYLKQSIKNNCNDFYTISIKMTILYYQNIMLKKFVIFVFVRLFN